ncbi:hypothetical protein JHL22_05100 [Advenella sp. WQ 585]|uniref:Lipoprotein n=1 Tax=Advenella mandrilli TaxID=2800330 RepID=A0ABS1EC14_9BURK|nr:hypothetical protein [Advenella mandrilli]MBK1780588.1 hypothetical protein [Advenella mandrilli]
MNIFSKVILTTLAMISISGCVALNEMSGIGAIRENTSTFDGSKEVLMEPAFVYADTSGMSGWQIKMGVRWSSKMPKDTLVFDVYVDGAHSIERGKSLLFNIDGKVVEISTMDDTTDFQRVPGFVHAGSYIPGRSTSSKRYYIPFSLASQLVNAKDVRVKVLLSKTYVEGIFSTDVVGSAKPAIIKYFDKLKEYGVFVN